jgi:DNA-binding transcriptional LysR family regulator
MLGFMKAGSYPNGTVPSGRTQAFEPLRCESTFRIASVDYLDPLFLPEIVARLKQLTPGVHLELHSLSGEFDS